MTRTELTDYVRDRFGISSTETDRVAQIERQLNVEYVRLVASEKLAVATADLGVTGGNAVIALPADWLETLTIRQVDGNVWVPVTRSEISRLALLPIEVLHYAYAFEPPLSIRLPWAPTTTDATFATIEYVRSPALLTAGAHIPSDIPLHFHDLLAELVVHRIALSEEDQPLAQSSWAVAQSLRSDLREHTGRRGGRARAYISPRGLPR